MNGSREMNLTVIDADGSKNTTTFVVTVNAVNDNPLFESVSDFTLTEDFTTFSFELSNNVSDIEEPDSALTIQYGLNATGLFSVAVDNSTKNVTLTATANANGSRAVNFTVIDLSV